MANFNPVYASRVVGGLITPPPTPWAAACCCLVTRLQGLFEVPRTVAHQAPLSMEFSRQEYWSELPFPPPGHLPDAGVKPVSLASPALAGGFFATAPSRMRATSLSHFAVRWTVSHQAPLSKGFSRQESWSGLACPPPG